MGKTESLKQFLLFLGTDISGLNNLSLDFCIDKMINFYQNVRFQDCEFENDGDMIILEWGNYSWNNGLYSINITRQLIDGNLEDDNILQLKLSFLYNLNLDDANGSTDWCFNLATLDKFRKEIDDYLTKSIILKYKPQKVELILEQV